MDSDGVARVHQELIFSFTALFNLLVRMRYISPEHVSYPPLQSPPVDVERLRRLGFDDDAIAAAQVLPQLRSQIVWGWQAEGVDIAPNSKALNFLASGRHGHERQDKVQKGTTSNFDGAGQLPPWVLRLTDGGPTDSGVHMLLDARQGTIIQHRMPVNSSETAADWQAMPAGPIGVTLSDMIARIRALDWVPLVAGGNNQESRRRSLIDSPVARNQSSQLKHSRSFLEAGPSRADDEAALQQVQNRHQQKKNGGSEDFEVWFFRNELNHYHALRKIYLECGWDVKEEEGGPQFDGDRLEQLRSEFATRVKALRSPAVKAAGERQRIEQSAQTFADLPPHLRQMGLQQMPEDEELRVFRPEVMDRYSSFLREAAGDRAL